MFRSVMLSGFLALTTLSDSTDSRATDHSLRCRQVSGSLDANVTSIAPTLRGVRIRGTGTTDGDLTGVVKAEVLKPFRGRDLKVAFTITTSSGEIVARGKTFALLDPGAPDSRLIDSDLNISGGNGQFDAASGSMNARGQADTRARTISLSYHGEVCTAT